MSKTETETDWLVSGETWLGEKKTGTVRRVDQPYVGMQIPMAEGGYFEITALHFEPSDVSS